MVLRMEMQSVYCAIRTQYLNKIKENFGFVNSPAMDHAVFLAAEVQIQIRASRCEIYGG